MAAGKYDINIEQGSTFKRTITWKNAAGNPIDITGYSARLHMRESVNAAITVLTLTTQNGGIELGGALGTINLTASATDTSAILAKKGVYDLEIEAPNGEVTRLLEGKFSVSPEVTR